MIKKPILYIIRGAPGSGKTTYALHLLNKGEIASFCEADRYFENPFSGDYKFDPSKLKEAHEWCRSVIENTMKNEVEMEKNSKVFLARNIAVSNTFTRLWEIQPYIDIADKYGYQVKYIRMTGEFMNVHGVPESKVKEMRNRYEEA